MNKDIAPVLDEISAVLKKHDMVGLVVVGGYWKFTRSAP